MTVDLRPCPKCGQGVTGRLGGGPAAYGCREWEYEVECSCGLLWSCSPGDVDEEEAVRRGIEAWNERFERTCRMRPTHEGPDANGYVTFECDECGFETFYAVDCEPYGWCAGCGARIEGGQS